MSAIRLVVFDCDGTLVDSQAVIVGCMRQAFETQGLEPPPAQAVRRVVGLSLVTAVLELMPEPDTVRVERLADGYRAAFLARRDQPDYDESLFPGAVQLLDTLAGAGF